MILEARDIYKCYYQGKTEVKVLAGVNLQVQEGETIAILGKSGAGKSTLLSLLCGLETANEGKLDLLGKNIFAMSEDEITTFRAKHMGIVFQNFHLLPHLNAFENIMLPLEILDIENSQQRATELLTAVGLSTRSKHLPSQLSGGEKQRVAVARALAISPNLILADEPSGSLDEATGDEIMNLLFSLVEKEKRAMILVTHDNDLANRCSRKLILDHGRLHEAP